MATVLELSRDTQQLDILLVEDNPTDADFMRILLHEEAKLEQVQVATRLEVALNLIRHNHYDLILLDLDLPDSSGLKTLLKVLRESPATPVVVITGNDLYQTGITAVHYGAQDYLVKGHFGRQHLVRVLAHSMERQKMMNGYQYASQHDPLTNLANRALFMVTLQETLQRTLFQEAATRSLFAILFVDLDNFKGLNDRYGHHIGDQILAAVALRLKNILRVGDNVARLGGDEFAILIEGLSEPLEILPVLHRISQALSQPYQIEHHFFEISCSMGVALSSERILCAEELLQHADIAMYQAKHSGKGSYIIFNQQLLSHEQSLHRFETHLMQANPEDFKVQYQPIITLPTGQPFGFEVCVNWNHPDWQSLSDGEFRHLVAEVGQEERVNTSMLRALGQDLQHWQRTLGSQLALNLFLKLSERELLSDCLAEMLQVMLETVNLGPANLYLCLPEDFLAKSLRNANLQYLEALGRKGFQFYLEGDGLKLPSLELLERLPLELLQIKLGNNRTRNNHAAIPRLKGVLDLAHNLGLQVIVANVRHDEDFRLLQSLDCAFVQGNYFSEPMDSKQVSLWF